MNARRWVVGLAVVAAVGLVPGAARASTIPASSASHNTQFDISYQLVDSTNNIYKLYVTATYGSNLDYTYINDVAFKLNDASQSSDYDVTPTVTGPPTDTWTVVAGGISNSSGDAGCSGNGGGFWCAQSNGLGAQAGAAGTTATWTFTLDLASGVNLATNEGMSFKAGFTDASGNKVGSIISTDVTIGPCTTCGSSGGPVPEPGSLLLLASGLAGFVGYRRRQRQS